MTTSMATTVALAMTSVVGSGTDILWWLPLLWGLGVPVAEAVALAVEGAVADEVAEDVLVGGGDRVAKAERVAVRDGDEVADAVEEPVADVEAVAEAVALAVEDAVADEVAEGVLVGGGERVAEAERVAVGDGDGAYRLKKTLVLVTSGESVQAAPVLART